MDSEWLFIHGFVPLQVHNLMEQGMPLALLLLLPCQCLLLPQWAAYGPGHGNEQGFGLEYDPGFIPRYDEGYSDYYNFGYYEV